MRLLALLLLYPAYKRGRLARACERLGPSFIKLGQTLSTRPDVIGEKTAEDLAQLRDRLPPFAFSHVQRAVQGMAFATLDEAPVAAASVAQVHRAVLADGRAVAVKVLRPRIHKTFQRDLRSFARVARVLERFVPAARRLRPSAVVAELARSVALELDLRMEAAAMEEMRERHAGDTSLKVPAVVWSHTRAEVLTAEWVDGVPIHDASALCAAGHEVNAVLSRFAHLFFMHALRDGFFHADLHPGNVRVDAEGRIVLLDFGIMGRLSRRERRYIAEIFQGFLAGDWAKVARVHFRAGYVPAHHSEEAFAQAARAIAQPILGKPAAEISMGMLLGQLFQVSRMFDMHTQPQLLLLQKTLVVVEGIGRMLNPSVNMWELARAPIEAWAAEQESPAARLAWLKAELCDYLDRLKEALAGV